VSLKLDTILSGYPLLRKDILLYEDKGLALLVNPYREGPQKLTYVSKNEALLFRQLAGNCKVKDLCRRLPMEKAEIMTLLKRWSGADQNAVRFLRVPIKKEQAVITRQAKDMAILSNYRAEVRSAEQASQDNGLAIKQYHRVKIRGALEQFENIEMTVSHFFRIPHAILGGKNYGASFCDILMRRGALKKGARILEVGGGTGIFAMSFLDQLQKASPKAYKSCTYALLDISPVLLEAQRKMLKPHRRLTRFVRGDIESKAFVKATFDLIISNEMIADLTAVKLTRADIKKDISLSKIKNKACSLIREFKITVSDAPQEFMFNLGAVGFLKTVKKILKPKGEAYIVEYGNRWSYPRAAYLKGHAEYSIHFGHLAQAAGKLGLNPVITSLLDFFPFDRAAAIMTSASYDGIKNCLLPFLGLPPMPDIPYTEDAMRKYGGEFFNRLSFVGLTRLGEGEHELDPAGFLVLNLKSE